MKVSPSCDRVNNTHAALPHLPLGVSLLMTIYGVVTNRLLMFYIALNTAETRRFWMGGGENWNTSHDIKHNLNIFGFPPSC